MASPTGFNPNHKVAEGAHSGAAAAASKPADKPEVKLANAKIQKKSQEDGLLRAEPKTGEPSGKLSEKTAKRNPLSPEGRQELRDILIKSGFSGQRLEDEYNHTIEVFENMDPDGIGEEDIKLT